MKRTRTRSTLFGILIAVSLCSYLFLNVVNLQTQPLDVNQDTELQVAEEEIDAQQREIYVPDVALLQKILETTRKLLSTQF